MVNKQLLLLQLLFRIKLNFSLPLGDNQAGICNLSSLRLMPLEKKIAERS